MAVDETRHPHYGGRKRPGECSSCHRYMLVQFEDNLEDGGSPLCMTCIAEAVESSWEQYIEEKTRPDTKSKSKLFDNGSGKYVYEDEECPERAGGDKHHRRWGSFNCAFCGFRCYPARRAR